MTSLTRRALGALTAASLAGFALPALAQDTDVTALPDRFLGAEDAALTVIEYASLTCPHCANFHTNVYPQLKTNFIDTGKIKFVLREVYFDKFGLWAGMLARCGDEARYFPFVDVLFKQQDTWLRAGDENAIVAAMFQLGRQTGLTDDEMGACVQDGELAKVLVADYQLKAEADGITSTPSFVIDGETMGPLSYPDLEALLNEKLGE